MENGVVFHSCQPDQFPKISVGINARSSPFSHRYNPAVAGHSSGISFGSREWQGSSLARYWQELPLYPALTGRAIPVFWLPGRNSGDAVSGLQLNGTPVQLHLKAWPLSAVLKR